jgi:hypothetical protein
VPRTESCYSAYYGYKGIFTGTLKRNVSGFCYFISPELKSLDFSDNCGYISGSRSILFKAGCGSSASTGVVGGSATRLFVIMAGTDVYLYGGVSISCLPLSLFEGRKFTSTGVDVLPALCHYKTAGMEVASTGVVGDFIPAFAIIAGQGSISTGVEGLLSRCNHRYSAKNEIASASPRNDIFEIASPAARNDRWAR